MVWVLTLEVLSWAPGAAAAQTILNTERYYDAAVSGAHLSLNLHLNGAVGNTDLFQAGGTGMVGYRGRQHWIRLLGGASFLRQGGSTSVDNRFGQVRYNIFLTPTTSTFHFVQVQSNLALLLKRRWLLGSGIRARVWHTGWGHLDLGTGVMWEDEQLNAARLQPGEADHSHGFRLDNLVSFRSTLRRGVDVRDIAYLEPRLNGLTDVRVLDDLGLDVALSRALTFQFAVEWRYDSRPPQDIEASDLTTTAGIVVDLR